MSQVYGKSADGLKSNWEEAVRLDLYYVENWSLWLDLVILWKTTRTVAESRGCVLMNHFVVWSVCVMSTEHKHERLSLW